jgi:hypothetical protein
MMCFYIDKDVSILESICFTDMRLIYSSNSTNFIHIKGNA